jgi:hypothetical protein
MPGQRPGIFGGSPDRIRTGVTALRGRRPRPLDDGAVHPRQDSTVPRSRDSGMASGVQTTASQPLWRTGGHAGGPSAATRLTAASTSSPFPLAGRPLARIVVSSKPTRMSRPRRTAARSTGQVAAPYPWCRRGVDRSDRLGRELAGSLRHRGRCERLVPPFRQALISMRTSDMNKRGRGSRPRCQLNCWGTRTRT